MVVVWSVGKLLGSAGTDGKHLNGVAESLHHHQTKPDQVQQSDMGGQNLLVQSLSRGLDWLHDLQGSVVVSQKNVDPRQGDQAKVAKKLGGAEFRLISEIRLVDLTHFGRVNLFREGGKVRNDSGHVPNFLVRFHHLLFLGGSAFRLSSVVAEALKLVHKLVNHIPEPHHWQL
jgi:hypothetical protein